MATKKNAIAVREVELTTHGTIPSEAILEAVKTGTKLRVALDADEVSAAMLEHKLAARSIDEMGNSGELDDIADIDGQPVRVYGVGFRNSDDQYASQEGSLGVYAVLNVATTSGETRTIGSGATDVVVSACKILELGLLDTWWVIAKSPKATRAGFHPTNMTPANVNAEGKAF